MFAKLPLLKLVWFHFAATGNRCNADSLSKRSQSTCTVTAHDLHGLTAAAAEFSADIETRNWLQLNVCTRHWQSVTFINSLFFCTYLTFQIFLQTEFCEHCQNLTDCMCRADEADEQQSPCPFCGVPGLETEMDCIHCQNIIPFCIASGAGILLTQLPNCLA